MLSHIIDNSITVCYNNNRLTQMSHPRACQNQEMTGPLVFSFLRWTTNPLFSVDIDSDRYIGRKKKSVTQCARLRAQFLLGINETWIAGVVDFDAPPHVETIPTTPSPVASVQYLAGQSGELERGQHSQRLSYQLPPVEEEEIHSEPPGRVVTNVSQSCHSWPDGYKRQ